MFDTYNYYDTIQVNTSSWFQRNPLTNSYWANCKINRVKQKLFYKNEINYLEHIFHHKHHPLKIITAANCSGHKVNLCLIISTYLITFLEICMKQCHSQNMEKLILLIFDNCLATIKLLCLSVCLSVCHRQFRCVNTHKTILVQ